MKQSNLYRTASSLYRQKEAYQRNMFIGMFVASLIIVIPAMIFAYWPVEEPEVIIYEEPPDTLVVNLDFKDKVVIIRDEPHGGSGPKNDHAGAAGLFVDQVNIYKDESEFEFEDRGFAGNVGDGAGVIDVGLNNSFGNGAGGLLMIEDDHSYLITDSLDRIPEMIYIPDPVYPPLAQKAEIEGIVLLEVLVDIDGQAKEVKIKDESNPGYGFGQKAVDAASKASFVPALRGKTPVKCWVSFSVKFEIK